MVPRWQTPLQQAQAERPNHWLAQEWKPALPVRAANQKSWTRTERVSRGRNSPRIPEWRTPAQQAQQGRPGFWAAQERERALPMHAANQKAQARERRVSLARN